MKDAPQPTSGETGGLDAVPLTDETLGGYFGLHNRPPAFEGFDGYPYTVSLEVEKTPSLKAPFSGYLVFPRWAESGAGIVGHIETPLLFHGSSREGIMTELEALTLQEVSDLLGGAILRRQQETE